MTRRVERAKALLRRGDLSVTEVAYAVGYASLPTFSTRFKELVGLAPGAYRSSAEAPRLRVCIARISTRPVRNRSADPGQDCRASERKAKIQACFLHNDADAALAFYRDALGFEVRQDDAYEGLRWLRVGPTGQPETFIALHPPALDPGVSAEVRQTVLTLMAKGSLAIITLATDDVDALFDQVQATGADVVQEPTDQDYGVRDWAFRDPAGNLVRINQIF